MTSSALVPAFHRELGDMEEPRFFNEMVADFKAANDERHPFDMPEDAEEVASEDGGSDTDSED